MLVAPVVEKGATTATCICRRARGSTFWTNESIEGGARESIGRSTGDHPLYVRARRGAAMGPVKQYVDEPTDELTTLVVYPAPTGHRRGTTTTENPFEYRKGLSSNASSRVTMDWRDAARELTLRLLPITRAAAEIQRRLAGSTKVETVTLGGDAARPSP
jgi:alpha-glucosidase (family GH31 glycosyl hydrolase)